jgi:hypothetical protein
MTEQDDFLKLVAALWRGGEQTAVVRAFAKKFDLPESEVRWLAAEAARMIAAGEAEL